jgi:hypothetical protein
MMALGNAGNEDSVVCFVTWFTSIVSIVLGLDGLLFLEDHHLPGFKFEGYRPVEAFTGESADEGEGFFHWLWDHSWRMAGSKRTNRVSGSCWDGIWRVRASSKSWPAPTPIRSWAWRAVNIFVGFSKLEGGPDYGLHVFRSAKIVKGYRRVRFIYRRALI